MRVGINTYYKITQEFPVPSKTTNCGIGRWYKECEIEGFSSTNDGEDKSQKQWSVKVKVRVRVWNGEDEVHWRLRFHIWRGKWESGEETDQNEKRN